MASELWNASCILMILGFVFAGSAMLLKYYGERQEPFRGRAEARVVNIITEPRTGDASMSEFRNRQAAVFEFYAGGKLIKVTDPSDTYPCRYVMNQRVSICYNPENPNEFRILQKNRWKLAGKCLHYLGIFSMCIGCALFLMHAARIEL